jgi:hypothetical protein
MKIEIDTNLDSEEEIRGAIALAQEALVKRKERMQAAAQQTAGPDAPAEKKEAPRIILEECEADYAKELKGSRSKDEPEKSAFDRKRKDEDQRIPQIEIVDD